MNVICDSCKKGFTVKTKKKEYGVDIRETYFECTHCKKHYTSFVTNQEARKLQKEIKALTPEKKENDEAYQEKMDLLERKNAKLKEVMLALKSQVMAYQNK